MSYNGLGVSETIWLAVNQGMVNSRINRIEPGRGIVAELWLSLGGIHNGVFGAYPWGESRLSPYSAAVRAVIDGEP